MTEDEPTFDDDSSETVVVLHEPNLPSRGGMPGETAFLTAWQELMASCEEDDEDGPLADVHSARWSDSPSYDQADATMAATLIQWLGTNAGACMIQQARALVRAGVHGPDAFRAAWAIRNGRREATNSGLRSIETMMVPADMPRSLDGAPYRAPEITVRQYETAEQVCRWLGTSAGHAFLAAREREMEAYHAHERLRQREDLRTGKRMPHGMSAQGIADYFATLRKAVSGALPQAGAA